MRDGDFYVRGKEISRVEGLSDAVFGFAITLLVISLEVPHTAVEVLHAMRGFFAFTITFSALFAVWKMQFGFFRRYGLEDNITVVLTAVLLFVVLFFVYPMKFVFNTIVERLMYHLGVVKSAEPMTGPEFALLYMAFALGWTAVLGVFALLYRHAYSMREALRLSPLEVFDTRMMIWQFTLSAIPGLLIALMTFLVYLEPKNQDAIVYPFLGLAMVIGAVLRRHRRRRKAQRLVLLENERRTVEA